MDNLYADKSLILEDDEEIPSYQVPRDTPRSFTKTPGSPTRLPCFLPSSVITTVKSSAPAKLYQADHSIDVGFEDADVRKFCSAPERLQTFFDKDISWASSMESIVEQITPDRGFNTVEKATFFPNADLPNDCKIQPRALWSASSAESLDVKPLELTSDEDANSYERGMRVSDVCSVFQSLNVKLPLRQSETIKEDRYEFDLFTELSNTTPSNRDCSQSENIKERLNATLCNSPLRTDLTFHCSSPSVFTPEPCEKEKVASFPPLKAVLEEVKLSPYNENVELLGSDKEKNDSGNDKQVELNVNKVKISYGLDSKVTPLVTEEDEIFRDLIEAENASSQFLFKAPANRTKLPYSDKFLPFTEFCQYFNEKTEEKKVEREVTGKSVPIQMRSQEKPSVDFPPPDVQRAKKLLRLDVSSWDSSLSIDNSQLDMTDSQMFLAVEKIESTLSFPKKSEASPEAKNIPHESLDIKKETELVRDCIPASTLNLVGFKTANNNPVMICDEALSKAKAMFEEDVKNEKEFDQMSSVVGFRTANNTSVTISNEALSRARSLFRDEEDRSEESHIVGGGASGDFIGFKTASNQTVKISETSLARVKRIFQEDPDEITNDEPESKQMFGFRTAGEKPVQIASVSFEKAKRIFQNNEPSEQSSNDIPQEGFIGFRTGNNTAVKISEQTLRKVKDFFNLSQQEEQENVESEPVQFPQLPFESNLTAILRETTMDRSTLNASEIALLEEDNSIFEDTDWDDTTLLERKEEASEVKRASAKRPSQSPCKHSPKRRKIFSTGDFSGRREMLREKQKRQGAEKERIRPEKGLYFRREKKIAWQEMLPEGPRTFSFSELQMLRVPDEILAVTVENSHEFRFYVHTYFNEDVLGKNGDELEVGDGFLLIPGDDDCIGREEFERAFAAGPGIAPDLLPEGWVRHHYALIVWKLACYQRAFPSRIIGALTPHNVMLQLKYRYDREVDRSESSCVKRILERDDTAAKPLVLVVLGVKELNDSFELLLSDGWYNIPARCDPALEKPIRSGKIRIGTKIMTIGAELVGCDQGVPPLERTSQVYLKISSNSTRRVRWYQKLGFQRLSRLPSIPLNSIMPLGGNTCCVRVIIARTYPMIFMERFPEGRHVMRNFRAEEKASLAFQREQEKLMEKLILDIQGDIRKSRNDDLLADSQDPGCLEGLSDRERVKICQNMESLKREAMSKFDAKKAEISKGRNVRPLLRLRVVDLIDDCSQSAIISWWQPDEELVSSFTEGSAFAFYNLTFASSRNQAMYLNSCRNSYVEKLSKPSKSISCRTVLRVTNITPDFAPSFGEIDAVGLVVYLHSTAERRKMTVYITDSGSDAFLGIVFWNGLEEFCCEDLLAEGLVVGICNVQWRQSSNSGPIPLGYVSETTIFTHNSKSRVIQSAIDDLKQDLEEEDIPSLIERCQNKINTILSGENVQSSKLNSSLDHSKSIVDYCPSPQIISHSLASVVMDKPQAASTPVKDAVNKRIKLLQKYGEAPPLSPIPIVSLNQCRKPFKSPAISNDTSSKSNSGA